MRKFLIPTFLLCLLSVSVFAQSGRKADPIAVRLETDSLSDYSVALLFSMASNYATEQFTEFEAKKIPYTAKLHLKVLAEQKQLAAKYANHAETRSGLSGDDFYYLGRLHWMATNATNASIAFERFLSDAAGTPQKMQTSRSVVVVIAATTKDFEKAEKFLSEYYSNAPTKVSEIAKMEKDVALSYIESGELERAVSHAEAAFKATQENLIDAESRAGALNQLLDAGITLFEVYRDLDERDKAESALKTLRDRSLPVQSHGVYYRAIDELIKFQIETNRKPQGLALYRQTLEKIRTDFFTNSTQEYLLNKFRKREPQYGILGESAPDLASVESWMPGVTRQVSELKGKVILLDFWATWCGPCLEAFPSLKKWDEDYKDDGLEILGVTRFYNSSDGSKNARIKELNFISEFKKRYNLPYSIAVTLDQENQITYGATAIPTAVLIDRKGIVRYVESGTSESREEEILKKIKSLLAE
ncbi:MAG: TlpA disulfide reductase family protein [Pyrinomonadaceae bacterium]